MMRWKREGFEGIHQFDRKEKVIFFIDDLIATLTDGLHLRELIKHLGVDVSHVFIKSVEYRSGRVEIRWSMWIEVAVDSINQYSNEVLS